MTTGWGPWCWGCGHPAAYHGATFCMVIAGGECKQQCDCTGYVAAVEKQALAWGPEELGAS
jgi:hypothetical protein